MMVTITWNPLEFHLLDALPKGNTFNAEYYRVNILREFLPLGPHIDGGPSLFMLTTQNRTLPKIPNVLQRKSAPPHRTPTVLNWSRTIRLFSLRTDQILFAGNRFSIM
jgi:hypothetical protein